MNKDNKKFIIETIFLKEALKHDITLKEFIVLMYFDNENELAFDVKKVSKATCISEEDVLNAFSSLLEKNLISINTIKNEAGKLIDKVSLENMYNSISTDVSKKSKEKQREDFFAKFQEGYKSSLSGMDFDIINTWLTDNIDESLILRALEEANYNGVTTIRYIDKIIYEWKKKGYKTPDDVNKHLQKQDDDEENENKIYDTVLMEYNWLDEQE